jgi:hypothetical protein
VLGEAGVCHAPGFTSPASIRPPRWMMVLTRLPLSATHLAGTFFFSPGTSSRPAVSLPALRITARELLLNSFLAAARVRVCVRGS